MRFSFVTIHVKDLDKSLAFYTDVPRLRRDAAVQPAARYGDRLPA